MIIFQLSVINFYLTQNLQLQSMNLFLNSYHPLGNNRLDQNFMTEGLAPAVGLRQEQLPASQPA